MLISETSTTAKKEYTYDQYLRLSEVTESVINGNAIEKSFTFGYEYDAYGRLSKEIYPHNPGEKDNLMNMNLQKCCINVYICFINRKY